MENKEMMFEEAVNATEEVLQGGDSFKLAKNVAGFGLGVVIGFYVVPKIANKIAGAKRKHDQHKAEKKAETTETNTEEFEDNVVEL